jgi:hypothetical protein
MTAQTMVAPAPPDDTPHRSSRRRRWIIVLAVLVLVAAGAVTRVWAGDDDIRSGTRLVDADGLAAEYGIKVNLLALVAAGGLVELRYQVVDPDKADPLLHDDDLQPALVVEDSGATLVLTSAKHHHSTETELGGTYFILFANAHNAIHGGDKVTLVLRDVRLEHLEAQR